MKAEKAEKDKLEREEAARLLSENEAALYVQKVQRGRQARKDVAELKASKATTAETK